MFKPAGRGHGAAGPPPGRRTHASWKQAARMGFLCT